MSRVILADQDYGSAARILNLLDAADPQEPATLAQLLAAAGAPPSCKILTADQAAFANQTAAQPLFTDTASDSVALEAATYLFAAHLILSGWTNAANRTYNVSFVNGTGTIGSMDYIVSFGSGTSKNNNISGPNSRLYETNAASQWLGTTIASAPTFGLMQARGVIIMSGAGTIAPNLDMSTAPGTAMIMERGSYMRFEKLASNPQGTWS